MCVCVCVHVCVHACVNLSKAMSVFISASISPPLPFCAAALTFTLLMKPVIPFDTPSYCVDISYVAHL